jgi:hypothetical protein
MREMNSGGGGGGGAVLPPPTPAQMIPQNPGVIQGAMPNTAMAGHVMDNGPATAHIIGGSAPTPADFAAAMQHSGSSFAAAGAAAPAQQHMPSVPVMYKAPRSFTQRVTEEFKVPMMVAVIVFVFSLPVINFLFAHYIPSMVLPTGQLTSIGLVIKSLAAGASFWVIQRVIVPLFS